MATSQTGLNGDAVKTAPYVPFKSFLTALDRLKQGHPPTIDGSFWHNMSGGLQRQMILSMKFMGLIGENGEVSKELDALSKAEDRRGIIAAMLRVCYPSLFALGLEHATPNQFNDAMRQYNVSGSTLEKARSFFLQAARFAEISLSESIQHMSKRGASGSKRRGTVGRVRDNHDGDAVEDEEGEDDSSDSNPSPQRGSSSRTIKLRGGGKATLSFDVDVWSMTPEDQQFVFDMIKRMTEYERGAESKG